jgi:protein-S-isoprenylcysteine O-methyltransferase Ste14
MVDYEYGYWWLVIANALIFMFFILSFLAPRGKLEWRSMGVIAAFIVALFTEMYGFPLTIFILTSLLGTKYPALNPFAHMSGHLVWTFLGGGWVMFGIIHLLSDGLIIFGFVIMGMGWKKIHRARGGLVSDGIYSRIRHPQYTGLFLVSIGLLIQWPTVVTLASWPILMFAYYRLARKEQLGLAIEFGEDYDHYAKRVPAFFPARSQPYHEAIYSLPAMPEMRPPGEHKKWGTEEGY